MTHLPESEEGEDDDLLFDDDDLEDDLDDDLEDDLNDDLEDDSNAESMEQEEELTKEEDSPLSDEPEAPVPEEPISETSETPLEEPIPETPLGENGSVSPKNIPINIVIEAGSVRMSAEKLMYLKPGNMLELESKPENGVNLVINGKQVGRGELIKIGEALGVRILQID